MADTTTRTVQYFKLYRSLEEELVLLVVWLSLCLCTGYQSSVHRPLIITATHPSPQLPTMRLILGQCFLLTSLIVGAVAHDNGMDMNMDHGTAMNSGNMIMYLHFAPGDNLWFIGWAPGTTGAMVGTCIALFMLSIAERWLAAMRGVMEAHWRTRALVVLADKLNTSAALTSPEERIRPSSSSVPQPRPDMAPPFVVAYDVPRGIMQLVLASINFLLMLTVMTFQLSFILAIVIGLGMGEALFGRYSLQSGPLH